MELLIPNHTGSKALWRPGLTSADLPRFPRLSPSLCLQCSSELAGA